MITKSTPIIRFSPENLARHMRVMGKHRSGLILISPKEQGDFIVTTRDEPKGRVGDVFHIEKVGDAVLVSCRARTLWSLNTDADLYKMEGFDTVHDYVGELKAIYNNSEQLPFTTIMYVHVLLVIRDDAEQLSEWGV